MGKLGRLLLLLLLCLATTGCRARTKVVKVPVERVKIEYIERKRVDSIIWKDSVMIARQGDTVFVDKVHWRERVKEVRDTVARIDTVTVVKTVEVEVQSSRWRFPPWRILIVVAIVGVFLSLLGVAWRIFRGRLF